MNKNLLYSTRNSTQYSVMTYMRKEKDRCMCITDSLCCTTETNSIVKNQLYSNKNNNEKRTKSFAFSGIFVILKAAQTPACSADHCPSRFVSCLIELGDGAPVSSRPPQTQPGRGPQSSSRGSKCPAGVRRRVPLPHEGS